MELTERCDICRCEGCRGMGYIKGLFHNMICDQCDGLGYADPSGQWLDSSLVALMERYRLEKETKARAAKSNELPSWAWLRGYRSVEGLRAGRKGE